MDFQEQQRRRREEQLAADQQKRTEKRASMQAPPESSLPGPSSASPKVEVESTKYVPTIPDYALKIEFGEQQKAAPITAYNRFKLLNTPQGTEPTSSHGERIPPAPLDEESL